MNRNIIDAISTLIKIQPTYLDAPSSTENFSHFAHYRSIEEYVKNLFVNSFLARTADKKRELWHKVFSHFGNATNLPDLMLRGDDAIEIKSIVLPEDEQYIYASMKSLTLNTVYPEQKLYADDSLVTKACRKAERWEEKDIIYAVGISWGKRLKQFCMVYGQDYCASPQHYEKILQDMRARLKDFPNRIEFSRERSLGRVNNIDTLGATHLDLRNMWYIKSSWNFFATFTTRILRQNLISCASSTRKNFPDLITHASSLHGQKFVRTCTLSES